MNVLAQLSNSEKAVIIITLILGATVMLGLGKIAPQQWIDYTTWLAGIYVGGKTVQGAASAFANKIGNEPPVDKAEPETPPAEEKK